jgi:hypothetical protein
VCEVSYSEAMLKVFYRKSLTSLSLALDDD